MKKTSHHRRRAGLLSWRFPSGERTRRAMRRHAAEAGLEAPPVRSGPYGPGTTPPPPPLAGRGFFLVFKTVCASWATPLDRSRSAISRAARAGIFRGPRSRPFRPAREVIRRRAGYERVRRIRSTRPAPTTGGLSGRPPFAKASAGGVPRTAARARRDLSVDARRLRELFERGFPLGSHLTFFTQYNENGVDYTAGVLKGYCRPPEDLRSVVGVTGTTTPGNHPIPRCRTPCSDGGIEYRPLDARGPPVPVSRDRSRSTPRT